MKYKNIRKLCKEIENGNNQTAIKIIENTNNLDLYTYPVFFAKFFSIIDYDLPTNPLIVASEKGNIEVVEQLLQKGANPNIYRKGHWTPIEVLYVRRVKNRYEIAKLLIQYGADVNLVASGNYPIFEESLIMYNKDYSDNEILLNLNLLIENDSILNDHYNNNVLMLASSSNRSVIVEYLIKTNKFNINQINNDGKSALIMATSKNNIDVVKILLNNGANKEIRDNLGKSALDYAIEQNFEEIIKLLSD